VDVRVIGACNRDLHDLVLAGHFREDLFYRLNVVEVRLPPLGARVEDIAALASFEEQFLRSSLARNQGNVSRTAASIGLSRVALHKKIKQ
jgi:transcriptional regulator with PAS, ATPase and Fis domain